MVQWWRGFFSRELARVRRDGRAAVLWSLRVTVAATASYVVASLIFPGSQPLLAPLTAMLVVQVTPLSLLASGLDRVIAVVAGVVLAVGFAAVVPLEWWSLGILILVSITIGQYLRLRSNLVEVAISAMLVLGVGAIGAEAAAWQRIAETLVGAAVGIFATLIFPPKVPSGDAGRAIDGLADAVSALLVRAADELGEMAESHRDRLPGAAREWLDDSRRITHDIPRVGAALLRAEEGRRLNLRAAGTPHVEPGLRQGMEALEHSAVAVRSLMRSVLDCADDTWLTEDSAAAAFSDLAATFRELAAGVDAFGELVRNEANAQVDLSLRRHHPSPEGRGRDAPRPHPARRSVGRGAVTRLDRALLRDPLDGSPPPARARTRRAGTPPVAARSPTSPPVPVQPPAPSTPGAPSAGQPRRRDPDAAAAGRAAGGSFLTFSPRSLRCDPELRQVPQARVLLARGRCPRDTQPLAGTAPAWKSRARSKIRQ